ncbi:unnamed protein product [Caenorhabditis auriculariae]|uniref:Uncharacterized protein n=1 Tax=Caenorhabditis auriculariae TaxID=2777116 RepID=A0A8S1HJJ5_9PELO|nr:unnamed protein product [Caenorhabditis auriculariae]
MWVLSRAVAIRLNTPESSTTAIHQVLPTASRLQKRSLTVRFPFTKLVIICIEILERRQPTTLQGEEMMSLFSEP